MASAETELEVWLKTLGLSVQDITGLSGDVSRRRYYRLSLARHKTAIAVHYPEDMRSVCSRFVATSALLAEGEVHVPRILETDCARGFMLVEDVGRRSFYDLANEPWTSLEPLYGNALEALRRIQRLSLTAVASLNPALDGAALHRELELSWQLLLGREEVSGSETLRNLLRAALDELCERLDDAPLVPCHRDFMARNLLLSSDDRVLVVIDHQDLRPGPPFYDLASLLNDSLFPPLSIERALRVAAVETHSDLELYRRCVVQRALKAAGTFVLFANRGDRRHLPLVGPILDRAGHHLARLPEGSSFAEDVLAYWQAWAQALDKDKC